MQKRDDWTNIQSSLGGKLHEGRLEKDQRNNLSNIETAEIKRIFAEISHYREHTGSIKITTRLMHEGYTWEKPNLSTSTQWPRRVPCQSDQSAKHGKWSHSWSFFQQMELSSNGPINNLCIFQQRVQDGKLLPMVPEPTVGAPAGKKLCSGSDEGEIEGKKNLFSILDWNALFF